VDPDWDAEGLGLAYGRIALVEVRSTWLAIGSRVARRVTDVVDEPSAGVEHVGSTSVEHLLAKPIIDIAIGLPPECDRPTVTARLEDAGFLYRGDAGDDGGLVFVYEVRPRIRVVHVHVVELDGPQWDNYLRFRARLRADEDARRAYSDTKARLADRFADDHRGYTAAKSDIVASLLSPG
jgi:GrpB-like predicted nucleotidyltransferase (UPF0157 family)